MQNLANLKIGFIGAGRLARALALALQQARLATACVASRSQASAEKMASELHACKPMGQQELVDCCDLVFISTPDAAIKPLCDSLVWHRHNYAVHCSGATPIEALAKAHADGAEIGGFHPLQAFGDPLVAAQTLAGCTITIQADGQLAQILEQLVQQLGCVVHILPPGQQALYHAAAGFVSQFINALFYQAAGMWQSWGASEQQALVALLPLLRGSVAALASAGIQNSLPGPVSRGDVDSVKAHLQALTALGDEDKLATYKLLCAQTVKIALAADKIDTQTAQLLTQLLNEHPPFH